MPLQTLAQPRWWQAAVEIVLPDTGRKNTRYVYVESFSTGTLTIYDAHAVGGPMHSGRSPLGRAPVGEARTCEGSALTRCLHPEITDRAHQRGACCEETQFSRYRGLCFRSFRFCRLRFRRFPEPDPCCSPNAAVGGAEDTDYRPAGSGVSRVRPLHRRTHDPLQCTGWSVRRL